MKIRFKINYKTQWGQVLKIIGNLPGLGNDEPDNALEMFPVNGESGDWDAHFEYHGNDVLKLVYKYALVDTVSGTFFEESGQKRSLCINPVSEKSMVVMDYWRSALRPENALHSAGFTNAIFRRDKINNQPVEVEKKLPDHVLVHLQIEVPRIEPGHKLGIIGILHGKAKWTEPVPFDYNAEFPRWSLRMSLPVSDFPLQYKYCILNETTNQLILEEYETRYAEATPDAGTMVIHDEDFKYPRYPWKGSGVAIPVFSLRSKSGFGVGEFNDIKLLVDWAKQTGLKMVQILPVNDTVATHSWKDSYPYAAISVFALHPIYLNLEKIGTLSPKMTQEIMEARKESLNDKETVDYEAVMRIKSRFYKLIYEEQKNQLKKDAGFKEFYTPNEEWLIPYAAFSYLRDLFGTPDFTQWGRFSNPSEELLMELTSPLADHYDDIAVHYFIQYHLHKQLKESTEYARSRGVILKGDIPIGIYRNSVDAWTQPELYHMDKQAGAPPDDFSDKGQNWKFPTYNWDAMKHDNFSWWKKRLQKLSQYFDAFRIDHILGFFRIWEIPKDERQGIMGRFNPSIPVFRNEIESKGIYFDFFRFCRPFIRDYMLGDLFGYMADEVKHNYLVEYEPGKFHFRPEFDNQAKIEKAMADATELDPENAEKYNKLQEGLYYLASEVLFFEAPDTNGEGFLPRHSIYKTYSFRDLDGHGQQAVMEIYHDYFFYRNEAFWEQQALVKLPALKSATNMLICGEDLGMVPSCVPHVMNELGILSLEVQRMPKNQNTEFAHPAGYPYLSVATPSSHDTSTIRGWWEEDSSRAQRFYSHILGREGGSPFYCEPWIVKEIIVQHLYAPSMWAVFPLQDLLGVDAKLRHPDARRERINVPGNAEHYWRYRMHLTLEDLIQNQGFSDYLRGMINASGRLNAY